MSPANVSETSKTSENPDSDTEEQLNCETKTNSDVSERNINCNGKEISQEAFHYDDILEHIGQIGKFQLRTAVCMALAAFFPGIVVWSYTFTGFVPRYR